MERVVLGLGCWAGGSHKCRLAGVWAVVAMVTRTQNDPMEVWQENRPEKRASIMSSDF